MAGVNKVILLGNLGSDPEVRALPSGVKVANINIATSEAYTGKDGQRVEQTEWHRVELWDNLATIAEQYLKKEIRSISKVKFARKNGKINQA